MLWFHHRENQKAADIVSKLRMFPDGRNNQRLNMELSGYTGVSKDKRLTRLDNFT